MGVATGALLSGAAPVLLSPAAAQTAGSTSASTSAAEARLRKIEAEVRGLQKQVFPGGDGKYFPPEISRNPAATPVSAPGAPATTAVTDLLTRMDSVEAQLSRLTARGEENGNRIALLEAKIAALTPPPPPVAIATVVDPSVPVAPVAAPAPAPVAVAAPVPVAIVPTPPKPPVAKPAVPAKPVAVSSARLAAVKGVERPQTSDAADDEYSYGYRLWEAKFFPEAEQQLQIFMEKYPRHARMSYARNLLGRAYLDDGKQREAAQWFLKNYQTDKKGARAPDSLLLLAEAMTQLKDTNRACVALGEFTDGFAAEATGRLKSQYDATRASAKCN
ncbi:MAG: hypothetical protein ABJA20_10910 [Novosphingobium sp.]